MVQLNRFEAKAHATLSQYDIKRRTLDESYQEYVNPIESIIGVDLEDANSEATVEAYMVFNCEGLRAKLHELCVEM